MVAAFATLIVSVLLVFGIRTNKTSFMLPWIIETGIQTTGTFLILIIKIASPGTLTVLKAFTLVIYIAVSVYFILCVYSLYLIFKIQKKSVIRFLDHEFEATEGDLSFVINYFVN